MTPKERNEAIKAKVAEELAKLGLTEDTATNKQFDAIWDAAEALYPEESKTEEQEAAELAARKQEAIREVHEQAQAYARLPKGRSKVDPRDDSDYWDN